jgi:hypothetical protein
MLKKLRFLVIVNTLDSARVEAGFLAVNSGEKPPIVIHSASTYAQVFPSWQDIGSAIVFPHQDYESA